MSRDNLLEILTQVFEFIRRHRTVMIALAAIVVFITTYILILPALT